MSVSKQYGLNALFFSAIIVVLALVVNHRYALLYGVFVGLVNLVLSYGFLHWNRWRVAKKQGQSLSAVMQSVVVRGLVIGCLLILGFSQWQLDGKSVVIGFVLGQICYFFTQLIGIIKYGK